GAGAVLVLVAALMVGRATVGGDGEEISQVVVPRPVERRTLTDTLTVSGELRREELQTINSAVDGKVSSVLVSDGDTVEVGDSLFDLDGRSAVAVEGDFAFFRTLDVGSDGPDVEQLERILSDQGYSVGTVDRLFTEATRNGLAQWQFDQGYGGFTPEPNEAVTVSLSSNSAGYSIGEQNTIAVTIGPNVPAGTPGVQGQSAGRAQRAVLAGPVKPVITVAVSPAQVNEGSALTFTFTANPAPTTDLTIDLTIGGDATGGLPRDDADYEEIDDTFVFPAGQATYQITVDSFVDDVVESAEDIDVELTQQFNDNGFYVVGPINAANGVIRANGEDEVPVLTIEADADVIDEGSQATFTIEADVERNEDYDIPVSVSGSASAGGDYTEVEDTVTMTAGSTSVDVTVATRQDDRVERDETVTVSIGRSNEFVRGSAISATTRIESDDLPELTLLGGGTVAEGGTARFWIVADQPLAEPTSVNYQISGSAQAGDDFDALTGTVVMPAGATQVSVPIRTVDDDIVFIPSDLVVADWPAQVGTVSVDDGEFVLQGSAVLTLTEPVFTVNLSVSASDRAELEVGQPVVVDIAAGNQTSEGVISELDESATVDEAGNELYGGVVEITDPLTGVDGASVTIDVILDERPDVLVVPVAAVLQQGGGREVRIINDDGTIDRVTVEVGLVDDEYIEITSGLEGDEIVVVSVDEGLDPG
ncbi:MAG: Calx-beta domain-containing protein, partial [Acidimicrobiales bacterium]